MPASVNLGAYRMWTNDCGGLRQCSQLELGEKSPYKTLFLSVLSNVASLFHAGHIAEALSCW